MGKIELSEWLKTTLEEQEMSQAELARRSGLSASQISRIISMTSTPSQDAIVSIARSLHVPAEHLLRVIGTLPPTPELDPELEEASSYFFQLSRDDRDEIIALMLLKIKRRERERGRTNSASTRPNTGR